MSDELLFSSYDLGPITLKNRVVMAPMTRSRAIDGVPNELMAQYYAQRAQAGLIISEGVSPSPNGLGYARIPGLYSQAQIEGWRLTTKAVHEAGGRIYAQIMHTGRVSHPANMPQGAEVIAPSAVQLSGQMYTDAQGMQDYPTPRAMEAADLEAAKQEYVQAAKNAIEAGFDGVELHSANGYLLDQFLHPCTNQRQDQYGGSPEARNRFVLEVAQAVVDAIGADRTGIRVSPMGVFNDIQPFEGIEAQFEALAKALGQMGLGYLHIVDHSAMGAPPVPASIKQQLQAAFGGTFILSGGYNAPRAEVDLQEQRGDLVAFGRPFISNPDLVARLQEGKALAEPRFDLFYTPGPEGYTDYPTHG